MTTCFNCQTENDEDVRFCIGCGHVIDMPIASELKLHKNDKFKTDGLDVQAAQGTVDAEQGEPGEGPVGADINQFPAGYGTTQDEDEHEHDEMNAPTIITRKRQNGRLVLPDESFIGIDDDNVQRLVGRADLGDYTDDSIEAISRSHFTVYRDSFRYKIKDGRTNVQDRPSKTGTFLNDKRLDDNNEVELNDGDTIVVSDVVMSFKV